MRNRVLTFLVLCCASLVFAADSGKIVENGIKPKGKAMQLVFEKELVFGAEEEQDVYTWGSTSTSYDVDDRGHIFIGDVKNHQVHEFDAKGKFVATIVQKGQGPGEASDLASYQVLDGGGAVMLESGFSLPKITWFDKEGKTNKELIQPNQSLVQAMRLDPSGQYMSSFWVDVDQTNGTIMLKTGILNRELKTIKMLSEVERPAPSFDTFSTPTKAAQHIGGNIRAMMAAAGVATFDNQGHVYTAMSNRYEITKYSLEDLSKPLLVIKKEYKPFPMPEAEIDAIVNVVVEGLSASPLAPVTQNPTFKEKAREFAEPPSTMNAIGGLVATEDGHLLVIRRAGFSIPVIEADVFNAKGQFIGTASWDSHAAGTGFSTVMIFKNGKAHTLLRDAMGELRYARFSYKLAKK